MGHARKPGRVASIRVNPTECLQVLDFLDRAGISAQGRSFSTCVGIVFHALLQDAKERGYLKEVDGFKFNEKMAQFLPPSELATSMLQSTPEKENTEEVELAQTLLQKLVDIEESGQRTLTPEELLEKHRLMKIVFN